MTDSSILTTQNAAPLLDVHLQPTPSFAPLPSPSANGAANGATNGHAPHDAGNAEEGAIKCICTNPDDDGSTVMCDKCGTWQHIICYYADRDSLDDDDSHFCVDCLPREIDTKAADERQRAAHLPWQENAPRPRKPTTPKTGPGRPGHKSKKRSRPESISQVDGPPGDLAAKDGNANRRRGRHQSSASISNTPLKIPAKRMPNAHVQNPLKSPHSPPVPSDPNKAFSPEFMQLYRNDSGEHSLAVSQFEDINVTNLLSDWVRNADALEQVTNGKTHNEIFKKDTLLSDMPQVPWVKHRKEDRNIIAHGTSPQWIYITAENDVKKEAFVGELIGKIGFMQGYTEDSANRWEYLRHPLPFVFFHPQLPIVIDTREEGSVFRYLRRSCEPNLVMKTILEGYDYHFCFMATREISAGTELTIPWTLDEHVRRFFAPGAESDVDEEYVSNYTRNVLAEFGGCACNGPSCVMAQWAGWTSAYQKSSKGRRNKRGVGSRSSSEVLKQHDDDEELEDATAASSSSRSKPQSRDNTPSSMVDAKNIIPGEQLSEREKRKIEAIERSEQGRHPDRKKKRRSGDNKNGNPPPTPGAGKRGSFTDRENESPPIGDTALRAGLKTSPSPLQSTPVSAPPPPPLPHSRSLPPPHPTPSQLPPALKPTYSEAGCQADLDCSSLSQSLPSPVRASSRRSMSSLHRRIFRNSVLKSETASPKPSPLVSPDTEKSNRLGSVEGSATPEINRHPERDVQGDVVMSGTQEVGLGIAGASLDKASETVVVKAPEREQNSNAATESDMWVEDSHSGNMKPPPTPQNMTPLMNGISKDDNSVNGEDLESLTDQAPSSNGLIADKAPVSSPEKSPKEQHASLSAPRFALEVETAAAVPSPIKKKKISLTQYSARRNSSHVSNSDKENDNKLSVRGSDEASRSLSPLREEAREFGDDGGALETPNTENGDPMLMA